MGRLHIVSLVVPGGIIEEISYSPGPAKYMRIVATSITARIRFNDSFPNTDGTLLSAMLGAV